MPLSVSPILYDYVKPLQHAYEFTSWAVDAIKLKIEKTVPLKLYKSRSEFVREALNDKMCSEILFKEKQKPKNYPTDLQENEVAIPYVDEGVIKYEKRILKGDA